MKVRFFDVCVLGTGIGGLLAAILLQKKGLKPVVLSDNRSADFDPLTCEFLNGFTIKPMLKRVGFHPTEVNAIPSLEAPLQLIFSNHRLDCYGDERRFQSELRREFPKNSKQVLQLFKESYGRLEVYNHLFNSRVPLPPKGFLANRQFQKVLEQVCDAQLLRDRPLRDELKSFSVGEDFGRAVEAMQLAMRGLVTPWTSGAQLAHLLAMARWEGYDAAEGVPTVRSMLLAKLKERGGVIVPCDQIKSIHMERKKVVGFDIEGSKWTEVRCRSIIVAGDPKGLFAIQPDADEFSSWKKQLGELPVFSRKAYQEYHLHPEGIPVGMKPQGLLIPEKRSDGGEERRRWIRAIRYVVRDGGGGNGEKRPHKMIGLTAFMAPNGGCPEPKKVAAEIEEGIKMIVPFLSEHMLSSPKDPFVPSLEGKPGDFRQAVIYTSDKPRRLGVCGFSPETPVKNAFLAGDMIFPGLGLDGEIISGFQVVHFASKYLSASKQQL